MSKSPATIVGSALANSGYELTRLLEAQSDNVATGATPATGAARIPPLGVIGPQAIREAFDGDLRQLSDLLQGAIKTALELTGEEDWWPYVRGLFADYIVVEGKDGKLLSYPYTTDGTKVTLGVPTEVIQDFRAIEAVGAKDVGAESLSENATFIESTEGGTFRICIIRAGLSGNGNYYPSAVLREAAALFDGARVMVKTDQEHLSGQGKSFENLIGGLQNISFIEGSTTTGNTGASHNVVSNNVAGEGELHADLVMIEPNGDTATKLREAISQGLSHLFGFSIDVMAQTSSSSSQGRIIREAKKFTHVRSVDLIVEPGAGGTLLNLIEAKGDPVMDREQMIRLLEASGASRGALEKLSDAQLVQRFTEALSTSGPEAGTEIREGQNNGTGAGSDPQYVTRDELRLFEARSDARTAIQSSSLPDLAQSRLIDRFANASEVTSDIVREAIGSERDYLASFAGGGTVQGLGTGIDGGRHSVFAGETQEERDAEMLEACLDMSHKDHRQAQSFKECYIGITGDRHVTGQIANCHAGSFREALNSTSFSLALGNSMNRRMLMDYNSKSKEDAWRQISYIGELSDFREQKRLRFGGYGDMSIVAEGAAYPALASPDDEEAKFTPAKRGGTEQVTLEMIKNDDVNVIRRIPGRMSRAAKRTLSKFVFDLIIENEVIYDGKALFHADHKNLTTIALAKDSFSDARVKMLNQTEAGSDQKLFFNPKTMLIPAELGRKAYDIFKRDSNNDPDFVQSLKPDIIEVWCWSDVNDWALVADPMDIPTLEISFLDGNQEPVMFVQDSPTAGSVFTNDKITYKLSHIYGGAVMDYRGFQKAVVA